ncbi:hypothetical protein BRADI_5g13430v3 [Brachypodium distachyon]|uniref:Uncharacterized protein n=1 Tax=Brachypodium distachyon TaxID=15368 RepID=I1IYV0_BRADI|nr:hypothetical protein BRADI_5g13430v3 [Brachypodium distachyon]
MDTNTKLDEAIPDLEQQLLPPERKLDEVVPDLEEQLLPVKQQPQPETKLDEAIPDSKQRLLPPPPPLPTASGPGHKLPGRSCDCELARAASARASAASARTMALVAATVVLAFGVYVGPTAQETLLAVFVAMFAIIGASSALLAWRVGRRKEEEGVGAWPGAEAERVLLWSFAMALVMTMTTCVSMTRAPPVAGSVLFLLGLVVGGLCFAEIVPSVFRVAHDEPRPSIAG